MADPSSSLTPGLRPLCGFRPVLYSTQLVVRPTPDGAGPWSPVTLCGRIPFINVTPPSRCLHRAEFRHQTSPFGHRSGRPLTNGGVSPPLSCLSGTSTTSQRRRLCA
eukprot:EG_transcript_31639